MIKGRMPTTAMAIRTVVEGISLNFIPLTLLDAKNCTLVLMAFKIF